MLRDLIYEDMILTATAISVSLLLQQVKQHHKHFTTLFTTQTGYDYAIVHHFHTRAHVTSARAPAHKHTRHKVI